MSHFGDSPRLMCNYVLNKMSAEPRGTPISTPSIFGNKHSRGTWADDIISEDRCSRKKIKFEIQPREDVLCVTKFMEGLKGLLQSGQYSDIVLNVKSKEFKVHKTILAAHSPVFAAMMSHDTKEKATGIISIEDGEPDIFSDFLQFLYSGSMETLNSENVFDLYIIADKYQVSELIKACRLCMIRQLSLETFCDVMALSQRYHDNELSDVASRYFLQNHLEIARSPKWIVFMRENLHYANELIIQAFELQKMKV